MLSTLSWRKLWAKVQPIDKLVRNCTSICTYLISSDFDRHVQLYLRNSQFLSFLYSLHQSVTSEIYWINWSHVFLIVSPYMAQNNCILHMRGALLQKAPCLFGHYRNIIWPYQYFFWDWIFWERILPGRKKLQTNMKHQQFSLKAKVGLICLLPRNSL